MVTARVTAAATGGAHVFVLATSAVVTGPTIELEAQFLPRRPECQLWPTVPQHDSALGP